MLIQFTNFFRSINLDLDEEQVQGLLGDGAARDILTEEQYSKIDRFFGGIPGVREGRWKDIVARIPDGKLNLVWGGRTSPARSGYRYDPDKISPAAQNTAS